MSASTFDCSRCGNTCPIWRCVEWSEDPEDRCRDCSEEGGHACCWAEQTPASTFDCSRCGNTRPLWRCVEWSEDPEDRCRDCSKEGGHACCWAEQTPAFMFQMNDTAPVLLEWHDGYTFGDLFRVAEQALSMEGYDAENVLFYDRENRRIDFGSDSCPVEENTFIHAVYITEEMATLAHCGPPQATATWPWPQEWEGREEWEARQEYDPEDVDGDECWQ